VGEGAVGLRGHHEYGAVARLEVDEGIAGYMGPRPEPESPLLSKRDRHDRRAWHHVGLTVSVPPDVVPEGPVIPVDQNSVEAAVNRSIASVPQLKRGSRIGGNGRARFVRPAPAMSVVVNSRMNV